jgi:(p)ppGpp synthase/HD superfamily hydrolase
METKQAIILESKKGDFVFRAELPSGATWGQSLDFAYEILQQIGKMSQENTDRLKPTEPVMNED